MIIVQNDHLVASTFKKSTFYKKKRKKTFTHTRTFCHLGQLN